MTEGTEEREELAAEPEAPAGDGARPEHAAGTLDIPDDYGVLEGYGLRVVEQVPIETHPNSENARYLATKRDKLGHRLHHQDVRFDPDPEAA